LTGENSSGVLCGVLELFGVGSLLSLLGVGEDDELALVSLQTLDVEGESRLALVCSALVD